MIALPAVELMPARESDANQFGNLQWFRGETHMES